MSVAAFISVCIKQIEIWCKRPELLSIWLRPAKASPGSWGCGGVCGGGGGQLSNQLQACNGNVVLCN